MSWSIRHRLLAATCGLFLVMAAGGLSAQEPSQPRGEKAGVRLYDKASSSAQTMGPHRMTAAELRQARAWKRSQQRDARIEAANRAGYHLSRPPAVAVPSMTSRYLYTRPLLVPVYVYPRY